MAFAFGKDAGPQSQGTKLLPFGTPASSQAPPIPQPGRPRSPWGPPPMDSVQFPSLGYGTPGFVRSRHPSARMPKPVETPPRWGNGNQSFLNGDGQKDHLHYAVKSIVATRNPGTAVAEKVTGMQDQKRSRSPSYFTAEVGLQNSGLGFPQRPVQSPPTWGNGNRSILNGDGQKDPAPYAVKSLVVTRNSGGVVAANFTGLQDQKRTRSSPDATNEVGSQNLILALPQMSTVPGLFPNLSNHQKVSPCQVNELANGHLPKRSRSPPASGSLQGNAPSVRKEAKSSDVGDQDVPVGGYEQSKQRQTVPVNHSGECRTNDNNVSNLEGLGTQSLIVGVQICALRERESNGILISMNVWMGIEIKQNVCLQLKRTAEREAYLIRPMAVLQKTIDYLLSLLDQPYDGNFLGRYNFLWDRMRAIRMDLRMQHSFNVEAITMLEQMVEPLELSLDLAKMTPDIRQNPEVLFARNVARACRTGNFIVFFRLAKKATYLQACLMHAHFAKLRTHALASLYLGLQTNQGIRVFEVAKWIAIEVSPYPLDTAYFLMSLHWGKTLSYTSASWMRAILMDLRMEHIFNLEAITMLERMDVCLTLSCHAFEKKGIIVPSEKEFRGHYALLKLDKHRGCKVEPSELSLDLAKMTPEIRQTPEVLFARDVARACRTGNFIDFFRLAKRASYLQACIMHAHFAKLQPLALASLYLALQTNKGIPVSQVAKWLAMEQEDVENLLAYYGFSIKDFEEPYMVKEGPFLNSDKDFSTKCSRLVHLKKSTTIVSDISPSSLVTPLPAEATRKIRVPFVDKKNPSHTFAVKATPALVDKKNSISAINDEMPDSHVVVPLPKFGLQKQCTIGRSEVLIKWRHITIIM
ncbi:unnamed protein product [Linum tenue]|uniref:SAC3/GANP/THP3 conserved domain-containing protein n=1 Tax=Linum tenue TaxID=586396 RepID=A0AAV0RY78_9ROSI|nr:unnamed protein product [Linum tenue]